MRTFGAKLNLAVLTLLVAGCSANGSQSVSEDVRLAQPRSAVSSASYSGTTASYRSAAAYSGASAGGFVASPSIGSGGSSPVSGQQLASRSAYSEVDSDFDPSWMQIADAEEPLDIQLASSELPRFDPEKSPQRTRGYFALRYGRSFYADNDVAPGFSFTDNVGQELISGSVGFNWGRYLGAELAIDGWESTVEQNGFGEVTEYAVSAVLIQGRFRYPLMNDRLTPYLVAGAGGALTQTNDRLPRGDDPGAVGFSGDEIVMAYAVGGGLEYFIADNISVGAEVKYIFLDADIKVNGTNQTSNLDSLLVSAGMRFHFPGLSFEPDGVARAQGDWDEVSFDTMRPYFILKLGGAFIPDDEFVSGFSLPLDEREQYQGIAFGADFNRYFGAEFAVDNFESNIQADGFGKVGELTITSFTPYLRGRYPVLDGRLVPYGLAGIGVSFIEVNDRTSLGESPSIPRISAQNIGYTVGVGAGIEYFIADNMAIGFETKYIHHGNSVEVAGSSEDVGIGTLLLNGGLRVYFP